MRKVTAGSSKSVEQGGILENTNHSSKKEPPSALLKNAIRPEHSALNEIGKWLTRREESSGSRSVTPVPDDTGKVFAGAGKDLLTQASSSGTDGNSELLRPERGTTPIPEPEDSWLDDEDLQSCVGILRDDGNEASRGKEERERSHPVQGMIGMSLSVMRDYYSIGPEATRQKACYTPFYDYLSKENHQFEDSNDDAFRFDKKVYLKMFIHEDAFVPKQAEYTGRFVLDEASLWPNEGGCDVPHEDVYLESMKSPAEFLFESAPVCANLDKLSVSSKVETKPYNPSKEQVSLPPASEELWNQTVPDRQTPRRLNKEAHAQALTSPETVKELIVTFTAAKSAPKQQNGRIHVASKQSEGVRAPVEPNRSLYEPSQHKGNIPVPCGLNWNIPGPSNEYPSSVDLSYQQREKARKDLNVTSSLLEQCSLSPALPPDQLMIRHVPVFPPLGGMRDQTIQDCKSYTKPQRFNGDSGVEAQVRAPQLNRNAPGTGPSSFNNPTDLRDKLNTRKALRNSPSFLEKSPIPTLPADTDSSGDEDCTHRRRFMRTVLSPSRQRLFSISKGLMPQDNLNCAQPQKPESTPKPTVEFEKERIVDEWGEELDYELESDAEEEPFHTANESVTGSCKRTPHS